MKVQVYQQPGRFPFILLSACVPVLTAILAFNLAQNQRVAITAGLLAICSHYYAPSMPAPDNYAIYMLLGSVFFLLAPRLQKWIPFTLGLLAGLMTLARSDGLLWLGFAGLTVLWKSNAGELALKRRLVRVFSGGFLILLGYLLVMGPWHYRTWTLFDTFLTPGGGRLLWLQDYSETFVYPAEQLTREHFLQIGWEVAIQNWVIDKMSPGRTGEDKTSPMFSIRDGVGALYEMLEPFAKYHINLTKIESRPFRKKPWEYIFFIDIEGHLEDDNIKSALAMVTSNSQFMKVLGSYPKAQKKLAGKRSKGVGPPGAP